MDSASSCAPSNGWRRVQAYAPRSGVGNGTTELFQFYDQGNCDSGWVLDILATRDDAGDLWEAVFIVTARDGIRGDSWVGKWGDLTLGAPRVGGARRIFVPYPMVQIEITGKASGAETGTVQVQGVAVERSDGRGLGGTTAIGYRTQTLAAGGGNTSYAVPPGATAYRVGAANGSSTAIKVSELSNGDDDLGTYALDPAAIVAPMEFYPTPPPTDPASTANQSAIQLGTPGGAENWTVSWLFDFEG